MCVGWKKKSHSNAILSKNIFQCVFMLKTKKKKEKLQIISVKITFSAPSYEFKIKKKEKNEIEISFNLKVFLIWKKSFVKLWKKKAGDLEIK